jgi:flagellar biosynthesis protein FlhG
VIDDEFGLRARFAAARPSSAVRPPEATGPPAIVVGSGKGGVGKSVVSVMLAQALAAQGRKVLLVDGDQNLGSLHVLLGILPASGLEQLVSNAVTPADLLLQVSEGLWLLPGGSGAEDLYSLPALDRARLHHRLCGLYDDFDVVIIDAGPGLESVVRVATMRATRLIVTVVPEPAALTDAYALIKIVQQQIPDLPIDILANRSLSEEEGRAAYDRLATATERFLRRGLRYLGSLPEDDEVRLAVRDPRRLSRALASSRAAQTLTCILNDRLELPAPLRLTSAESIR